MKIRKHQTKQILSIILVFLLTISTSSPVFAATARATTMKLEKSEGTVTVKTQNGASRKTTDGMRLYNGNSVETGKSSYAFISLDSSKAVKLSENANASLRQNGKKLELLVKKGQLFFNVSTKLGKDESMNIRTSTMVTGIRGTCGIVEKVSPIASKLYLLEGKVTLGENNPVTVQGGEIATINTSVPQQQVVKVDVMKEKEIPVFALEEVLKDPVLTEKIEKNSKLSIEKMEEVLEEAKKAEEEKQEEKPTETPEEPETPSQPSTPSIGDSGTGGEITPPTGGSEDVGDKEDNGDSGDGEEITPPTGGNGDGEIIPPDEPQIPAEPTEGKVLTGELKVEDIATTLSGNNAVWIDSSGTIDMTNQSITIPTGKTLIINTVFNQTATGGYKGFYMDKASKIVVEPNATLYVNGNIMGGSIELKNGSKLYNKGTIDGEAMTALGEVTIMNESVIKLQQDFTELSTETMVDYQGGRYSVLVSNKESTAMPTQADSSGTLLAYAVSGNSTADVENEKVQYIYADYLNSRAADYMNQLSTKQNSNITWDFSKDAVVAVGTSATLSGLTANLGKNQIQVKGILTLKNVEAISGYGEAVINVSRSGYLISSRDETLVNSSKYAIQNLSSNKMVIAVENALTSDNTELQVNIEWKDPDLYIQTLGDNPEYSIQGTTVNDKTMASNSFVSIPEGYELMWMNQGLFLNKKATVATQ